MFNLNAALTTVKKTENVQPKSSLGVRGTAKKADESEVKTFSAIGGSTPTIKMGSKEKSPKKVEKQQDDIWSGLMPHF